MAGVFNIKNAYITPIIIKYIDKYIKNVRLEDTKLSLWGGEAIFHNLNLRLEVLEEELALPFTFISGHIHELIINVPWTRLQSEPITVTIDTIECVLKLKADFIGTQDGASTSSISSRDSKRKMKRQEIESPAGYMQSLVNRIVNNVTIICKNLILKYVEEDMVLSLNIPSFTLQSANEEWQPAFVELSAGQLILRKLVTLQNLTICLDRRSASGKIYFYEEPLLFQCSMELRVSRTFSGLASSRATSMRMDVHCSHINFSVSEKQVPMLLRVLRLGLALYLGELRSESRCNVAAGTAEERGDDNSDELEESADSWVGWAWSFVPSILPNLLEEEESGNETQQPSASLYTLQVKFIVDKLRFVFKASESTLERTYYGPKNIKFHPLTVLEVYGCYMQSTLIGNQSVNVTAGASMVLLSPSGEACACGAKDTQPGNQSHFLVVGEKCGNYAKQTFFDPDCNTYEIPKSFTWDEHLNNINESVLLEKTPAVAMDYLYTLNLPDGTHPDDVSDDLETENLVERALCRFVVGPLQAHVCSGLVHRAQMLLKAANMYSYPPYSEPVPDPSLADLPPSSVEAVEGLESYMPLRAYQLSVFKPVIHVYLSNHPDCEPSDRNRKKVYTPVSSLSHVPHVSIECQCLDATFLKPMYPVRHVPVVCQQPAVPELVLTNCHQRCSVRLLGLGCHLNVAQQPMTILVPCHITLHMKQLVFPHLWQQHDMSVTECSLEAESFTLTLTKAQALLMNEIAGSYFQNVLESNYERFCCQEVTRSLPFLELNMEGFKWQRVQSASTIAHRLTLQAVKMFALQQSATTVQQVLVLSSADNAEEQVLTSTLQYQTSRVHPVLPTLLSVKLNKIDICADPLVLQWLAFSQFVDTVKRKPSGSQSSLSEVATSVSRQLRRSASFQSRSRSTTAPQESVHSYEPPNVEVTPEPVSGVEIVVWKTKFLQWYSSWRCGLTSIDIAPCNLYIPNESLSSLGAQSIEETLKAGPSDVLAIHLPSVSLKSNNLKRGMDLAVCSLPVAMQNVLWDANKEAFPCSLTLGSLTCSTRINGIKRSFLHLLSASCTIGVTSHVEHEVINSVALCVHVDTPTMQLGMCSHQLPLLLSVMENLHTVFLSKQQQAECPQETASQWDTLEQLAAQATTPPPTMSPLTVQQQPISVSMNEPWPTPPEEEEAFKLSAWLQWTMARLVLSLYADACCSRAQPSPQLKLVCEVEDMTTSVDVQQVYLKVKSKVATASVQHFYRPSKYSDWYRGPHMGLLLHCTDEPSCPLEESALRPNRASGTHSFLDVTFTRALSHNVHQRWAHQLSSYNLGAGNTPVANINSQKPRFISEIVAKLCPLDIVLPASVLAGFIPVFQPLFSRASSAPSAPWQVNNNTLPLLYLDTMAIRLFLPLSVARDAGPDLCIVHLRSLTITPHADNPLSRIHVRSELYYLAQQANILNVPGSLVEDRQYQLDVCKLTVHTGAWHQVEAMFQNSNRESGELNPLSENPAVEWNKLALNKQSFSGPNVPLLALVNTVNASLMLAPAIVYQVSEHLNILVCGHSVELNATSDIEVSVSTEQMASVSLLLSDWLHFTSAMSQMLGVQPTPSHILDSGIDDRSSVCSQPSRSLPSSSASQFVPSEVLVTANKIIFTLYDMRQQLGNARSFRKRSEEEEFPSDMSYDASEDSSADNAAQMLVIQPLLYAMILQPHCVIDHQSLKKRIEISCFDMALRTSSDSFTVPVSSTRLVPKLEVFTVCILETKGGDPHPKTGIPPSLLTATWSNLLSSSGGEVQLELGRPVRVHAHPTVWNSLKQAEALFSKFLQPLQRQAAPQSQSGALQMLKDISCVTIKTCQIMLLVSPSSDIEQVILSIAGMSGSFSSRSSIWTDRGTLQSQMKVNSLLLKLVHEGRPRVFLKPCNFTMETVLSWDPWLQPHNAPSVQTSLNVDLMQVELGPDQVECLTNTWHLLQPYIQQDPGSELTQDIHTSPGTQDEHYRDDLRAGAFQFLQVDGLYELPLPYQVIFYQNPPAMAWRYPQPRALTRVDVYPVPFISGNESADHGEKVACVLQYWSPCEGQYVSYCEFNLTETHSSRLNLPSVMDKKKVVSASCWQVLMHPESSLKHQQAGLSPRTLAASMRIDSFFSSRLVPQLQVALDVRCLQLDLTCQTAHLTCKLPGPLGKYTSNFILPDILPVASLQVSAASLFTSHLACGTTTNRFEASLNCDIVDMSSLTTLRILQPFRSVGTVTLSQSASKQPTVDVTVTSGAIKFILGPTAVHTLATAVHLWQRALAHTDVLDVLPTRYVVCNESSTSVWFRQCNTPEKCVISSGQCHMYAWYNPRMKQILQISLGQDDWQWSKPLCQRDEEARVLYLHNGEVQLGLVWRIETLSSTQKMIIISGQLVICNKLKDSFDIQVHSYINPPPSEPVCSKTLALLGMSTSASIAITTEAHMALKVQYDTDDIEWSDLIPVTTTSQSQPLLVKFLIDHPCQFYSLWCRVLYQPVIGGNRIVVLLTPLYKVRSLLPTTSFLSFALEGSQFDHLAVVKGQGTTEQLYCLGTNEDTFKLAIRPAIASGMEHTMPWPLSYSNITLPDWQEITAEEFASLFMEEAGESWPYVETDSPTEWVVDDYPNLQLNAKLHHPGPLETSVQLHLEPWALFVNLLDVPVSIVQENDMSLPVPPRGVIVPLRFQATFYLSVGGNQGMELSPPLQMQVRDESSGSFYIPRISGVIPLDGWLCTTIPTWDGKVMLVTLTSREVKEVDGLQVLSVRPTVMLHCAVPLAVLPVCVPTHSRAVSLPPVASKALHHTAAQNTESVKAWHCLVPAPNASPQDLAFYLLVQSTENEWACPLMLPLPSMVGGDGCSSRQCLDVAGQALVLTTHLKAGRLYAVFSKLSQPQLMISNHCRFHLQVAQVKLGSRPVGPEEESQHLSWCCQVAPGASVSYTMPAIKSSFPGPVPAWPPLILARAPANPLRWSEPVAVCSMADHFVSLPLASDVSVQVRPAGGATFNISVHAVSRIEISAKEIRARLQPNTLQQSQAPQPVACEPLPAVTPCSEEGCGSPSSEQQTAPLPTQLSLNVYIANMEVSIMADSAAISSELLLLSLDHVCASVRPSAGRRELQLSVGDAQLDNQMIHNLLFDFPVVFTRQEPMPPLTLNLNDFESLAEAIQEVALLNICVTQELSSDKQAAVSLLRVAMRPISVYIEDTLVVRCGQLLEQLSLSRLLLLPPAPVSSAAGQLPRQVQWEAQEAASPIQIQRLVIEPVSVLVSLHTSLKVFIALDRSPLHFSHFERSRVCTTNYRLGHELTRHYLSGALFRAGWVLGSLELLGSPSGFALTVGSGLRDFVCMPYLGFLQGPWGFITGITHGSASLMKHVTAGTVSSITNLASSVARNLERCSLDREHVERAEEARRQRPQGVGQGVLQGLSSLGISLLGAVSGIAHHPLQALVHQPAGSSQLSGLVAGVGLGLVGAITKPLSGAAELVALTGQGLLHGTGWSSMPQSRRPTLTDLCSDRTISPLHYAWSVLKFETDLPLLCLEGQLQESEERRRPVMLVLTNFQLHIFGAENEQKIQAMPVEKLRAIRVVGSNDTLCLKLEPFTTLPESLNTPHWRVEDFVRHVGVPPTQHPPELPLAEEAQGRCTTHPEDDHYHLHVQTKLWKHLLNILQLARREALQLGFPVLL